LLYFKYMSSVLGAISFFHSIKLIFYQKQCDSDSVRHAECPYPRGEGDGICALYISQLCQSASSG
jgi:hypothetical protein